MTDKEQLTIDIINMMTRYVPNSSMSDIKMDLSILLAPYQVERHGTEVAAYTGDKNTTMIRQFIAAKIAGGRTRRTVQYYLHTLTLVLDKIGRPYDEMTSEDIRLYLAYRVQRDGVTKVTANNERRALSAFYSWLQKEGILLQNPMNKVDNIKVVKTKKKAFDNMEMEKIRMACRTKREKAMIEVLASTWCRVSEVVGIRVDEINGNKILVHGKGEKDRDVYLNARALLAVQEYLKQRSDINPYLFPRARHQQNISKYSRNADWYADAEMIDDDGHMDASSFEAIIRSIGKRAEVTNCHPHRFRRTGATMALRAGMPLITVSKMLGHSSIGVTQIYLDVTDDELEESHKKYVV